MWFYLSPLLLSSVVYFTTLYTCYKHHKTLLLFLLYLVHSVLSSVQFSSVAQSCPTLCDPMNCSTPALPVHHQFLEFTQTHVY